MSNQGLRQASARAVTGTTGTYNEDLMALFALSGFTTGPFNERFLRWLNAQLGVTYASLPEAMTAFAVSQGLQDWDSVTSLWTPASLGASLYDMWDAERADTLTLAGAAVNAWASVKNGYSAAQAISASKPVYSATSFNGRPGVLFDGADDELTYAGTGVFPTSASASTIWILCDQLAAAADTSVRYLMTYGGNAFITARGARRAVVTGVNQASLNYGSSGGVSTRPVAPGDFSGRSVLRLEIKPTEGYASLNGTRGTAVSGVPTTATTRTRLGASTEDTASFFGHFVASFIAITGALSDAEAAQMTAFLKTRGGIA
jgi:hypothetical protein